MYNEVRLEFGLPKLQLQQRVGGFITNNPNHIIDRAVLDSITYIHKIRECHVDNPGDYGSV